MTGNVLNACLEQVPSTAPTASPSATPTQTPSDAPTIHPSSVSTTTCSGRTAISAPSTQHIWDASLYIDFMVVHAAAY